MGNDIKNQTEFASKSTKQSDPFVRWFYCTKTLSSDTSHNKEDYIQFRFDISSLIEVIQSMQICSLLIPSITLLFSNPQNEHFTVSLPLSFIYVYNFNNYLFLKLKQLFK